MRYINRPSLPFTFAFVKLTRLEQLLMKLRLRANSVTLVELVFCHLLYGG